MKRLSLLGSLVILMASIFTFTSCDETLTGGSANPPILTLRDNGAGSVTGDVEVTPGSILTFSVEALSGDNPMNNVRFLEDGSLVSDFANRLTINGSSATSSNVLLFDADRSSFTWEVTWVAHADESSKTYTIEIVDEAGNTDTETVSVNTASAFPGPINLTIVNSSGSGCFVTDATDVAPDSWFCVNLEGTRGANAPLVTLTVQENGSDMTDLARLEYNGTTFDANPLTLPAADVDGFVSTVRVRSVATQGTASTYTFVVTGGSNGTASTDINITTTAAAPNITNLTGVLLNAGGPAGQGGLDLETGTSTGSNDSTADIKDQGIDIALPNATNWIQRIAPVGTNILTVAPSSSEFPTAFEDIQYQSQIEDAYNLSSQVTQSEVVNIGDVFLLNNGTNIFIIKCTNVNVTNSDNSDSYTFDVKF